MLGTLQPRCIHSLVAIHSLAQVLWELDDILFQHFFDIEVDWDIRKIVPYEITLQCLREAMEMDILVESESGFRPTFLGDHKRVHGFQATDWASVVDFTHVMLLNLSSVLHKSNH